MQTEVNNIQDMKKLLSENISKMIKKERNVGMGKEITNAAGKYLGLIKLELDYNNSQKNQKKIDFFEVK